MDESTLRGRLREAYGDLAAAEPDLTLGRLVDRLTEAGAECERLAALHGPDTALGEIDAVPEPLASVAPLCGPATGGAPADRLPRLDELLDRAEEAAGLFGTEATLAEVVGRPEPTDVPPDAGGD